MRKFVSLIIGLLPLSPVRIFFYRVLLGYRISYSSKIGWLNWICCGSCEISGGKIGCLNRVFCDSFVMHPGAEMRRLNTVRLVRSFEVGERTIIVSKNCFIGLYRDSNPYGEFCVFRIGSDSMIGYSHCFDITDTVTVGDRVVFGGYGTSVWTHGFDPWKTLIQAPVSFADDIYVGSCAIIIQGVSVVSGVMFGAGTVVSRNVAEPGFYVSNLLERKGDCRKYGDMPGVMAHTNGTRCYRQPQK